jgi:hypothetical protein
VDEEHHRAILLRHCFEKHPGVVIKRKDLIGLEVAPSVGGCLFGKITGEELLIALPSEALTKMMVHTLCSVIRIARKEEVYAHLQKKIGLYLNTDGNQKAKAKAKAKALLDGSLKHSPNTNKKCHVTKLLFLARLSAVCRMETRHLLKGGATQLFQFEKDKPGGERCMESAVVQSLNALKKACAELDNVNDSKTKRKREETTTVENTVTEVQ